MSKRVNGIYRAPAPASRLPQEGSDVCQCDVFETETGWKLFAKTHRTELNYVISLKMQQQTATGGGQ